MTEEIEETIATEDTLVFEAGETADGWGNDLMNADDAIGATETEATRDAPYCNYNFTVSWGGDAAAEDGFDFV